MRFGQYKRIPGSAAILQPGFQGAGGWHTVRNDLANSSPKSGDKLAAPPPKPRPQPAAATPSPSRREAIRETLGGLPDINLPGIGLPKIQSPEVLAVLKASRGEFAPAAANTFSSGSASLSPAHLPPYESRKQPSQTMTLAEINLWNERHKFGTGPGQVASVQNGPPRDRYRRDLNPRRLDRAASPI